MLGVDLAGCVGRQDGNGESGRQAAVQQSPKHLAPQEKAKTLRQTQDHLPEQTKTRKSKNARVLISLPALGGTDKVPLVWRNLGATGLGPVQ